MASRFVVAVALFALCHGSPADDFRGKRSYTSAIGSSSGYSGKNTAFAKVSGDQADAQAANDDGGNVARDALGNGLPSQAYARVGTHDTPGDAAGLAYAQPAYYPLPAPATVVTYQQYAAAPAAPAHIVYETQPTGGLAQSSATSSGGYGSAKSNANTGYGTAASDASALGSGHNTASSLAQADQPALPVEAAVIDAKNQGLHSVYTPVYTPSGYNSASSNANVNGYYGSANSAARLPTRKSISWRFGTAYDQPPSYGSAFGQSALSSAAKSQGAGTANSAATSNAYGSSVRSATNTVGGGSSIADANVNGGQYAALRSDNIHPGYGNIRSYTSSQNGGSAFSKASRDAAGNESADSAAKSVAGGSAQAGAYNQGASGALALRSGGWADRAGVDSYSSGNSASSAHSKGLSTGYRVVDSAATAGALGAARSNAY